MTSRTTGWCFGGLVAALVVVMAGAVEAQLRSGLEAMPEAEDLPEAPGSHVLDDADLFKRDPEKLEAISRQLIALEDKHGLPVYLAVYGGLLTGGVSKQAQALYDAWIGDGRDGVVVVCDTDTRSLDMGLPRASFYDFGKQEGRMTRLPDYKMIPVLRRIQGDLVGEQDQIVFLEKMTGILVTELDDQLSAKPEGLGDLSMWKFIVVVVLVGSVLAGLGVVGQRYLSRADQRARQRYYLPDVLVGTRLGAPCGGGRVSEASFPDYPPSE